MRVLKLVFAQGFALVALGIALGVAGSMALSTFVESVLYGVAPNDPLVLFRAATLLGTAFVLACCLPAWRGASSNPMTILREV